ncbi:MAG TPA: phosphoribosylglycinamide formyltransferase [Acidimicrobiales bacterium]|nr:phosphoribosylglycinamide formyltransferase [Acidimicrobiales bacterium]
MRVGVLASGTGSILEAILESGIPVVAVIADRPCRALEIAEQAGVPAELVQRMSFGKDFDRDAYTHQVVEALKRHEVELVVMAGFGTIIPAVAAAYPGRVLNTHPALLPAFKGWHVVKDALEYGVKVTGVTVHIATEEVDAGPILAQEAVPVLPGDTEEMLHERIKSVERALYPDTIRKVIEGTLP